MRTQSIGRLTFAKGPNCLAMSERLSNPMDDTTIAGQRLCMLRASRDYDGIEHRAPLALEMMVSRVAPARAKFFAIRVDGASARTDDPDSRHPSFQGRA